jgi:2-amino-4-hydroxy-6-hydroxymethyldihydropteridine diphosphokinase
MHLYDNKSAEMRSSVRSRVIIGLGSNIGDRLDILSRALSLLRGEAGEIVAMSSVWETEPWGFDADEQFLNMVAVLDTDKQPQQLMQLFRSIEGRLGRTRRSSRRYESRTIDIDILLWEDRVISLPGLEVPHQSIADRRFVLVPMNEVASGAVHPVTGITVAEMLAMCDDTSEVRLAGEQF